MEDIYCLHADLLQVAVCTRLSDEETENHVNREYPTGISSRWAVSTETEAIPCSDYPDTHRHLILEC